MRARTARPSPASRHRRAASPRWGKSKPADHLGSTPPGQGNPQTMLGGCWGRILTTNNMYVKYMKKGISPIYYLGITFLGFNTHETSSLLLGKCSFHVFPRFVPEVQKKLNLPVHPPCTAVNPRKKPALGWFKTTKSSGKTGDCSWLCVKN